MDYKTNDCHLKVNFDAKITSLPHLQYYSYCCYVDLSNQDLTSKVLPSFVVLQHCKVSILFAEIFLLFRNAFLVLQFSYELGITGTHYQTANEFVPFSGNTTVIKVNKKIKLILDLQYDR